MNRIEKTIENLKKNRMEVTFLQSAAEVAPLVERLIPAGSTVGSGGSVTLAETGVIDLLRGGKYRYLDRARPGITPEEVRQVYRDTFSADFYLCSANAITEEGELVNADGNSNRIAALVYGPESVIVVAGVNKLVADSTAGIRRIKTVAAPRNTVRLSCNTYCREKGVCIAADGSLAAGCSAADRICCNYLISGPQRVRGRIRVILVNEELGY